MTDQTDPSRQERREDMAEVLRDMLPRQMADALPPALAEALPKALPEALPIALDKLLWRDMRPPRRWEDVRTSLEHLINDQEARVERLKALRKQATDLGTGIVKDIVIHVVISTAVTGSLLAAAWSIFHGAQK